MKFISKLFSTVLHPLMMPTYVFGFIFYLLPNMVALVKTEMFPTLLGLIVVCTFVFPAISVLLLYKAGVVSKLNIEDRHDRFIPQVLATLIYIATTWLFYSRLSPIPNFYVIMASITACMLVVTVINFFWKISAHSTAMGGMVAFLLSAYASYGFGFLLPSALIVIILAGIVLASRLYLHVHTLGQVCSGFLLGLTIGMLGLSNIS